jgi:hypothetical protein
MPGDNQLGSHFAVEFRMTLEQSLLEAESIRVARLGLLSSVFGSGRLIGVGICPSVLMLGQL